MGKVEKTHTEVVNHLNGGLIIIDENGGIKFHNRKMSELVGDLNLKGRDFRINYLPDESKFEYEDLIKRSKTDFEFTGRIKKADGTVFPAIITGTSIEYPGIKNAQMLIIIPSEHLERAIAGKFFLSIAHNLKTPITGILLLAERLRRKKNLPKFDHYFSLMKTQVDEFTSMVTNILGFSKLELGNIKPQIETVNLAAILRSVVKGFKEKAKSDDIELIENIPERLAASVDRTMFRVILNNILENALKYTNEGKISVDAYERMNEVIISISDTGLGVPADERDNIFEKFYRGKAPEVQNKDGVGIGLYLSKKYVELHRGPLTYEPGIERKMNKEGVSEEEGSKFTLCVPKNLGGNN